MSAMNQTEPEPPAEQQIFGLGESGLEPIEHTASDPQVASRRKSKPAILRFDPENVTACDSETVAVSDD